MNRRAFLSRLVAAPVVLALPVRPALTTPKLNKPIRAALSNSRASAVYLENLATVSLAAEARTVCDLWRAERLQRGHAGWGGVQG